MIQRTILLGTGTNYFWFNTKDDAGAPITLAGTPSLNANINGGTAVTAGLTLSVDHGSVTGLHRVAVDVDNGTLALADGDVIVIKLAAGTVDAVSVVGTILAEIELSDGSLSTQTKADINAEADTAISDGLTSIREAVLDQISVDSSVDDASATTTSFVGATGLSTTNDFYNGCAIVFTSGTLAGITRKITDYVGATLTFTLGTALPAAPANGVTFRIMGRIE